MKRTHREIIDLLNSGKYWLERSEYSNKTYYLNRNGDPFWKFARVIRRSTIDEMVELGLLKVQCRDSHEQRLWPTVGETK